MRRFGLQGRQIAGDRARLAAHGVIERAPDQQEEQQHDGRVEIGVFGVVGGFHHRHAERQNNAERDRHVHIQGARFERAPGARKERPPGISRGRQGDQRRGPVEEVSCFRRDIGDIARPYRHRQQHDVHGGKTRNRQAARQPARLGSLCLLGALRHEWMSMIAAVFQRLQDLRGLRRAIGPGHVQPAIGVVEAGLGDARQALHRAFNARNAGAAGDPVDRKLHIERAVSGGLCVEREVERFSHRITPIFRSFPRKQGRTRKFTSR